MHPNVRGHGIGKKLIEVSINKARELGVSCLRALIASDNEVMQQACKRMNLIPSPNEYGLYIKSPQQILQPIVVTPKAHLIRVDTLTYDGLWLEGEITASAIDNAHSIANPYQCDIMGAVVSKSNMQMIELLTERQFIHIDDYHRWTLTLKND